MRTFWYYSIYNSNHETCLFLILLSLLISFNSGSASGDSHTIDMEKTNQIRNLDSLSTNYPFWLVYGQPYYIISSVTGNIKTEISMLSISQESIENSNDNTKAQQLKVLDNLQDAKTSLDRLLALYADNKFPSAVNHVESIYSKTYEKVVIPLRTVNPDIGSSLNTKFIELISIIEHQKPYDEIAIKVEEIKNRLEMNEFTGSSNYNSIAPTIAFSSSFSIIFREGLEAALILGAIITYLEASRNEKFIKHVYVGLVLAVGVSLFIWFLLDHMLQSSGIDKDLLKGIVGISAVVVLFWVSFWFLNKAESKKWVEFIKSKVGKATITGSVLIFILISFFTVFREGIETVIFYQSLFSFTTYIDIYIISGFLIGLVLVLTIGILIKKIMRKLPLRVIFGMTMGIGAFMSVAFMGNAIRAFQESGYISTTALVDKIPLLDSSLSSMTGIHPTLESLLAQTVLGGIYFIGLACMILVKSKESKRDRSRLQNNR